MILARADVASAQIVPLVADGRSAGAILLGAKRTDVTNADSIGFARAMGNQLAQSIESANSFSRLAASEQRYRTVTEGAYDAISILKPNGTILEANRSLEEAVGLPKDQIIGRNIRDLAPLLRDDKEDPGTATEAPDCTSRRVLTRPDGLVVQMEFSNREIDVAGEKLVFSIGRDITAQVQAQTQLMVADRMASVGSLAAGVAHEINNPLAAVTANLEFAMNEVMALEGKLGPGEVAELKEVLAEAREAAERVRIITRDLKGFSRAEEERSGPGRPSSRARVVSSHGLERATASSRRDQKLRTNPLGRGQRVPALSGLSQPYRQCGSGYTRRSRQRERDSYPHPS